jgi:hypothetical protein
LKILRKLLKEFQAEQIKAFITHDFKHPNDSVTKDESWRNGHVDRTPLLVLCNHLNSEIEEWYEKNDTDSLVDISNMCFLIWTKIRKRPTQSCQQ